MPQLPESTRFPLKKDLLWLMIALALLIFVPSFIPAGLPKDIAIYFTLVLALLFGVISISIDKKHRYISVALAMVILINNALPLSSELAIVFMTRMLSLILFFSYLESIILFRISTASKVSLNMIYGAISGYLILGLLGGFWTRFIEYLYPGSFVMPDHLDAQLDTLTYFSFVTMSSLGYGDISPATPPGRSTAIFISIVGQMYLAITIALLVGAYAKDYKR